MATNGVLAPWFFGAKNLRLIKGYAKGKVKG